jgi:hypothetical protein
MGCDRADIWKTKKALEEFYMYWSGSRSGQVSLAVVPASKKKADKSDARKR